MPDSPAHPDGAAPAPISPGPAPIPPAPAPIPPAPAPIPPAPAPIPPALSRADRLRLSRMPVLPGREPAPGPPSTWMTEREPPAETESPAADRKDRGRRVREGVASRRSRRVVLIPVAVVLLGAMLAGSYLFARKNGPAHADPAGNPAAGAVATGDQPGEAASPGPATAGAATGEPATTGPATTPSAPSAPSDSAAPTDSPVATRPAPTSASPGKANPDRVNLARRAVATSSSNEQDGFRADRAVDGDRTTRWSSGFAEPQWIKLDLRAAWRLNQIRLYWEHSYAVRYRVDVSLDGRTWSTIWATTVGQGGTMTVDAHGRVARYVRMYGEKRVTAYGFSIFEFEVR